MTEVHQNRRFTGWFLLSGAAILLVMLLVSATQRVPKWATLWLSSVAAGFSWLAWIYIIKQPVLRLGNGWLEMIRKPFPALRIPLDQINSVRIRQPGADGGTAYFLEIVLNRVTPEIQGFLDTMTKRQTVKVCRKFGDYDPPVEPFLILPVQVLGVSDAELVAIFAREQETSRNSPAHANGPSWTESRAATTATPHSSHE
jgi:hypothetical protein